MAEEWFSKLLLACSQHRPQYAQRLPDCHAAGTRSTSTVSPTQPLATWRQAAPVPLLALAPC